MRLVFFGTPRFAVPSLRRLHEQGHEVAAVITQPDRPSGRGLKLQAPPVKQLALSLGIPVFQPERINTDQVKRLLTELGPEAIIVAAYGKILPGWMLELPRYGGINVHASLLPKYRGAAPINWAIINGERTTGVTIMQMDEGMDTGDILLQAEVEIGPDETAGQLQDRLAELGADLLLRALELMASGQISPIRQDHAAASYAPMLKKDMGRIDWEKPAQAIHNLVRGLNPHPGAFGFFRDEKLRVWRTSVAEAGDWMRGKGAGEIVAVKPDHIVVRCGDETFLKLLELQLPDRRKLAARDFINGTRVSVGERLR